MIDLESEITVIGAGPTGLMIALLAAEAGHRVVVREAAPRVGGMAGSFEIAGQRVDYGSHRLHPSTDPMLMDRLRFLLGDDLQNRERHGRIRLHGRWVGFPLRSLDMAKSLPASFTAKIARDTLTGPFRSRRQEPTFDAELTRRLGPTITAEFFAPYAHKLYGIPSTELSIELANRRVSASSPGQIVRKALKAARPQGRMFFYPRLGYGQIAERLADAAVAAGAEISLNAPVDRVNVTDDQVTVTGAGHRCTSEIVWSTMPIPALSKALNPQPGNEIGAAITALRTRAMVLVYLVVRRPSYTPFDAHYFPDLSMRTSRLSEPKNYRDGPDPEHQTVICAEVPCWQHDELWHADAEDMAALVVNDIMRAGLPDPMPIAVEVRHLGSVYPVYELATEAPRLLVESWLGSQTRVLGVGRQGLGVPDNLHHVLAMGQAAAAAFDAGSGLSSGQWDTSLQAFREHVVED